MQDLDHGRVWTGHVSASWHTQAVCPVTKAGVGLHSLEHFSLFSVLNVSLYVVNHKDRQISSFCVNVPCIGISDHFEN